MILPRLNSVNLYAFLTYNVFIADTLRHVTLSWPSMDFQNVSASQNTQRTSQF